MKNNACPLFMTHHAPVGAWSSLSFGLPGRATGIDQECNSVSRNSELLVALGRKSGKVEAFPFFSGLTVEEKKQKLFGHLNLADHWKFISPAKITRKLTPCVDEFSSGEMSLRVYTPHPALPDPQSGDSLQYACCPGILLELTIDNSRSAETAYGLLGVEHIPIGHIHAIDSLTAGRLAGVAFSGNWCLAAKSVPGKVFSVVSENSIATYVETCEKVDYLFGKEGGLVLKVPAGRKQTFAFAFGFYRPGVVTQGIPGHYYYTKYFSDVEDVCRYVLDNRSRIKKDCASFDRHIAQRCPDEERLRVFSQAVRAYYANTQLIEADGKPYYNVCEGSFGYRNTLDLGADHLSWELFRNPWVVRNLMDLFIDRYSYTDQVTFPESGSKRFAGGLTFTHDMGNFTCFSPPGRSSYERADAVQVNYMTGEQLLNGIYCLAAYALAGKDPAWLRKRDGTCRSLLASLENRDHHDPLKRTGILKGNSSRCAGFGSEITTYDCLDASLRSSQGSIYMAVKTWCACLMLAACFAKLKDQDGEARARKMAARTAHSLGSSFQQHAKCFPANVLQSSDSKIVAAIEPLAVVHTLGLGREMSAFPELLAMLRQHTLTCLQPGNCIDRKTGGLRLSSSSRNTWPSKSVLCLFVAEAVLGIQLKPRYASLLRELVYWVQVAAAEQTISDQIYADQRKVGDYEGRYYPRIVTSFLWVK